MPLLGSSPRRLVALWRTPAMLATALTAAVYQLCFFAGVSLAGVALGTLVAVGSGPVFAGIVGWVVLGHRPTRGWLVATSVCVVGLVLLSAPDLGGGGAAGLLLALGAGLCIAGYNVAAKLQLDRGATALEVPAGSFALGGLLLLPDPRHAATGLARGADGARAGAVPGRRHHGDRQRAPRARDPGAHAGPVTTLMLADPVVATVLGVVVLGETLAPVAVVGRPAGARGAPAPGGARRPRGPGRAGAGTGAVGPHPRNGGTRTGVVDPCNDPGAGSSAARGGMTADVGDEDTVRYGAPRAGPAARRAPAPGRSGDPASALFPGLGHLAIGKRRIALFYLVPTLLVPAR